MAVLTLKGLYKRYGANEAVKGATFTCEEGEFVVLLGPSGAGKTSILRMVAGLETVDEGDLYLDGLRINDLPPKDRDLSMAFESYALYPDRTVYENIAFPLRVPSRRRRYAEAEAGRRVREIAELLEIGDLLGRLPRQLSGGQRQRVALGRALVREASAHLLDEPIAHLDAKLRHRMRETLKLRQRQGGVTTLWATPDQLEAVSMADRVVVLNQGGVEQWGTPQELYRYPSNEFVARSIGEPPMNILDAKVICEPDGWRLEVAGARLPLAPGDVGRATGVDGHVRLGIRPSDIRPFPRPPEGPALEAEVFLYEPLGSYGVLTVQAAGKTVKVRTDGSFHFEAGQRVWLVPDGERSYFFHPRTGLAIGREGRVEGPPGS